MVTKENQSRSYLNHLVFTKEYNQYYSDLKHKFSGSTVGVVEMTSCMGCYTCSIVSLFRHFGDLVTSFSRQNG